jgi:hypothetical protein
VQPDMTYLPNLPPLSASPLCATLTHAQGMRVGWRPTGGASPNCLSQPPAGDSTSARCSAAAEAVSAARSTQTITPASASTVVSVTVRQFHTHMSMMNRWRRINSMPEPASSRRPS